MPQRSLYYWSKIYSQQLDEGQKYSKLKKTICINILDFNTLKTEKYHSIFKIKEDEENYVLTNLLEIHFLEMKKLKEYSEKDDLSQWVSFIRADSREVLEKVSKVNPSIDKAVNVLTTMSQDKKARAEYLSREMALYDEATRIEEATEEGRIKGRAEGREEGKEEAIIQLVRSMVEQGLDAEFIASITKLPLEKIKSIIINNK